MRIKVTPEFEGFGPFIVKVTDIQNTIDPFSIYPWAGWGSQHEEGPLTREEIAEALRDGNLEESPFDTRLKEGKKWARENHVRRVAYLVKNPSNVPLDWDDECFRWPLSDGNHRLAAAIFRGDEEILIYPYSDFRDTLETLDLFWEEGLGQFQEE